MGSFINNLWENPAYYVCWAAAVMISISIHEFSHAFVAHKLGDDTAYKSGFMTLNPFKVMGWVSIVALFVFGIAWGAVPVENDEEQRHRWRRAGISLAGPLANLILAFLFSGILYLVYLLPDKMLADGSFGSMVVFFLIIACYVNCMLCVFNMLPVPILDGWNVFGVIFPAKWIDFLRRKTNISFVLIYILWFTPASAFVEEAYNSVAKKILPQSFSANRAINEANALLEKNDEEGAFKKYQEAAEAGSAEAKAVLGKFYFIGTGCEVDYKKSFELLSQEDVRELPIAKLHLGMMFADGLGCERDVEKAYRLLSHPDVRDFPMAKLYRGCFYANGFAVDVDHKAAFELLSQEDVIPHVVAKIIVAGYYIDGIVCPKDPAKAFALLNDEECIKQPVAQFILGGLYLGGEGVEQNFKLAAQYIQASADSGHPEAMNFLGYQNGVKPVFDRPLEKILEQFWKNRQL